MNPPTVGHSKLIAKVIAVAKKEGGTPMVYPSKTEDKKKNPLSFKTKVKVLKDNDEDKLLECVALVEKYDLSPIKVIREVWVDDAKAIRKQSLAYNKL